jgi:hypothetical protein
MLAPSEGTEMIVPWTPFALAGRDLEWCAFRGVPSEGEAKQLRVEPATSVATMIVNVRAVGAETGPAVVLVRDAGPPSVEDAMRVVREHGALIQAPTSRHDWELQRRRTSFSPSPAAATTPQVDVVDTGRTEKATLHCSFCGKHQGEVRTLVAGPCAYMCSECIELCHDVINEEPAPSPPDPTPVWVERRVGGKRVLSSTCVRTVGSGEVVLVAAREPSRKTALATIAVVRTGESVAEIVDASLSRLVAILWPPKKKQPKR